jgi:hypothetical protein
MMAALTPETYRHTVSFMPKKKEPSEERFRTSMFLPAKLWLDVRTLALQDGRDAQEIVQEALEAYMKKKREKGGRRAD